MKRHAIALGKYRARPACDAHVKRILVRAFRRAIFATLDTMAERVQRLIWGPAYELQILMYKAACAELMAWNAWAQRELDEQIAGKMSDVWEPER